MKIEKAWEGVGDGQCIKGDDGEVWLVIDLIEQAKELPVIDIPLEHLCINRNVGNSQRLLEFAKHMKQVQEADLSYPILLCEEGTILDGCHRVIKALVNGERTIKAKRFTAPPNISFYENK